VVYAEALGKIGNQYSKKAYYNKFYGVDGLTAIQSTTAGAGVAVLELMISKRLTGVVSHSQILLDEFSKTQAFTKYYSTAK
jgi:saccharopine dehydrogenase-like NADP-dependent oxidoreductase